MIEPLIRRVAELVDTGWEPQTTTDTSASLATRGPFQWWLFVFMVILFPLLGGVLYVAFWLATSRVVKPLAPLSTRNPRIPSGVRARLCIRPLRRYSTKCRTRPPISLWLSFPRTTQPNTKGSPL